jgi:hypothetical protein
MRTNNYITIECKALFVIIYFIVNNTSSNGFRYNFGHFYDCSSCTPTFFLPTPQVLQLQDQKIAQIKYKH